MGKTYINIAFEKKLHDEILLLKLKRNARSMQKVVKDAIVELKKKLKEVRK
jgi:hypothetical protein